jgi:hypothetical protein
VQHVWAKVVVTDTCWLWTGCQNKAGYGVVGYQGKTYLVHRLVYQHLIGPIQESLDHLCRVKTCVRPDHLEDVTLGENRLRAKPNRDLCPNGHPYTRERPNKRGHQEGRICQTCVTEANRRWKARQAV